MLLFYRLFLLKDWDVTFSMLPMSTWAYNILMENLTGMNTIKWHKKSSAARLSVYQPIFDYLARVYLEIPDAGFINGFVSYNLFFQWPLCSNHPAMEKGIHLMRKFSKKWTPAQISDLRLDYTRLFTGFERILAPPYESVYLSKYHIMFEKQTLAVRRFYEGFGLQVKKKMKEPDDHIGLELLFVAHLCGLISAGIEKKESDRRMEIIEELKRFLSAHLLCWISLFLKRVEDHAETDFF
jgi:TorA maturation chaperone TorD